MNDRSTSLCGICDGEFYTAKMNSDGVCEGCQVRFPGAKSKVDIAKRRETSNEKMNEGNFDNRVIEIVNNILTELGILHKCECGKQYYKRSPAQKTCGSCPENTE